MILRNHSSTVERVVPRAVVNFYSEVLLTDPRDCSWMKWSIICQWSGPQSICGPYLIVNLVIAISQLGLCMVTTYSA